MAYFKLSLLDFAEDSTLKNAGFISSTMSEFYSQQEAHKNGITSFCYTYNENLSLHTNAQKELTFSIDRMVLRDNEWVENPFSRYMTIGTQLALEDSYHNQYFFIIKDVKYTFKEQNMTSAVTCQDAFTYQMSRQNDGYEITNDVDSDDFIGAKDIDWWVTKKVIPECFVSYIYLKLNQGLYIKNGKAYVFDNNLDSVQDKSGIKIVKQPYNRIDYKDYYETFAFSGSGTANSVLINLGEQIGLMTQTFEHFNSDNSFDKYFWFEPQQHEENNGLYYSPFSSVQSFSLSHGGSSLTTVLNVSGSSSDDEVVSLLPEITPFISQSFTSSEWLNSKWHANFFHDWVRERVVHYSSKEYSTDFRIWHSNSDVVDTIKESYTIQDKHDESSRLPYYIKENNGYSIFFPVSTDSNDNFLISSLYDNYSFITSAHVSEIIIKNNSGTFISLTPQNASFFLCIKDSLSHYDSNVFNYTGLQSKNMWLKVFTLRNDITEGTIESEDIYFRWYREPTSSDVAFAEVADEIPWLENKLINFSYFQRNSILSPEEVKNLTNLIHNNLRIANGKLIFYSKQYYAALHAKTKILADMENQFDVLGANFYADIVSPYATDKIISTIDNFTNAYNNIYSSLNVQQFDGLLNYTDTYSSYVNKYINSQQSFLKNIYNFVNYFNYPINLNNNMCLYEDKITIKNNQSTNTDSDTTTEQTVIFDDGQGSYQVISDAKGRYNSSKASDFYGKPNNEIYAFYKNSSSIIKPLIAYQNCPEWNNLYYINPADDPDQGMQVINNSKYDNKQTYYQMTWVFEISKEEYEKLQLVKSVDVKFIHSNRDSDDADYTLTQDDDKYFLTAYPTRRARVEYAIESLYIKTDDNNTYNFTNIVKNGFRKLTDNEIKILWILKNGSYESEDYIRVKNKYNYQPISNFYLDDGFRGEKFNPSFYKEGDTGTKTSDSFRQNYYKKIPLTSFYFRDHYWKTVVSDDKKTESYQITTSAGKSLSDYLMGNTDVNPWDEYRFYEISLLNSDNIGKYYLLDSTASAQKNISKAFYDWSFKYIYTKDYNQAQFFDDWDEKDAPIACSDLYVRNKIVNNYQTWEGIANSQTIKLDDDESALSKINLGLYTTATANSSNLTITTEAGRSVKLKRNNYLCYPAFANKFGFSWGTIYAQKQKDGVWSDDNVNSLHLLNVNNCYYKDKWLDPIKTTIKWEGFHKGNNYYAIPLFYEKNKNNKNQYIDLSSKNIYSSTTDFPYIENLKLEVKNIYDDGRQILDDRSLSSIINWPFNQQKIPITVSWSADGEANAINIEHFSNISSYSGSESTNNLIFKARYTSDEWEAIPDSYDKKPIIDVYFIICKERDYVSIKPTEEDVINGTTLYKLSDDSIVNPLNEPNCIDDLYVAKVFEDTSALQPAKGSQFSLDYHYYDSEGNRYYTITQLFQENNKSNVEFRWNNKTTYNYKSLSKDTLSLTLKLKTVLKTYKNICLQHQFTWAGTNNTWVVIGKKLKVTFTSSRQNETVDAEIIGYTTDAQRTITIQLNKRPSITVGKYLVKVDDDVADSGDVADFFTDTKVQVFVSELSKSFQQDFSTTSEKSGIIETKIQPNNDNGLISEISYYWSGQVLDELSSIQTMGNFWYRYHKDLEQPVLFNFAASIEAQLEEYWQAAYTASNYCEYFLPQYWQPTESGDTNYFSDSVLNIRNGKVTISSLFVPNVERYRNPNVISSGEEYLLPKYVLKYHPTLSTSAIEDGDVFADVVFAHNDAMNNIQHEIEIDYKDFTATKTSAKMTYYYSNSGGMKHADLIKFLGIKSNQDFANYSGLYVMEIKWLRDHYSDYPLDGYEAAREEHNKIWQNIYSKYPAMMLESKYSNTDATDSKQLLMLAKNYFKDLFNPERSYSITLINDLNNCIGYRGQELKVGDSIRLRANEFYDGFDDISSSLNQLLFITDIKYTLRKDTDISLTVNAIKYQNKLIKRLAKLIQ